ncbi:MAG: T9SS type A sorting domain-containing protein [Phaeodactylibacter sp.]|uniref:T9SS type A sorting domain-containing protein n=1 Tax=Phaeodactylibacter sp. TaxID=1940289 RepID=UPI0032EB8122
MKKTKYAYSLLTLLLFVLIAPNQVMGQAFVSPSNKWFIDDCSVSFFNGEIDCDTKSYWFEDTLTIDATVYYELRTNDPEPVFEVGAYYREEGGVVFMKMDDNSEEFAIYDFNLEVDDLFLIDDSNNSVELEVLSIDSVTLISGERRKRLEMADALSPNRTTYWIEGVGSASSPMNPIYTFSFDIWVELNCFHQDEMVEWQLGDCMLTHSEEVMVPEEAIICFPNPATDEVHFLHRGRQAVDRVAIFNLDGRAVAETVLQGGQPLSVRELSKGLYAVTVIFEDGAVGRTKFVKQ